MDFQELKSRIRISEIAEKLGYQLNRRAGTASHLEYKLYFGGTKVDEVLIYKNEKGYFSREGIGDKGDLIDFVKNRLNMFNLLKNGDDYEVVKEILCNHIGSSEERVFSCDIPRSSKGDELVTFNLENYEISKNCKVIYAYLNKIRQLSSSTIADFVKVGAISTVALKKSVNKRINVAFPFKNLGKDEILNYELRNYNSWNNQEYKSFCSGGNKSSACWCAYFVAREKVQEVYIGESAIDMMALYELLPDADRKRSAFISVGGNFVYNQVKSLQEVFPKARINLAFDNDLQGNIYDVEAAFYFICNRMPKVYKKENSVVVQLEEKKESFSADGFSSTEYLNSQGIQSPKVRIVKSCQSKDFNDMLKSKKKENSKDNATTSIL